MLQSNYKCYTMLWLDKWYQRNWSKYPRGESCYSNFWKPYWSTITQKFYSFCRLLWNISRPPVHLLVEDSTPCHIRPIKYTHVYHEIFFFQPWTFWEGFLSFCSHIDLALCNSLNLQLAKTSQPLLGTLRNSYEVRKVKATNDSPTLWNVYGH